MSKYSISGEMYRANFQKTVGTNLQDCCNTVGGACSGLKELTNQRSWAFFAGGGPSKRQALKQSVQTEGVYIGAAALTQYETNNKTMNLKMSIQMCDTELISHLLLAMRSFIC